jgi:hypothetical protein
MNDPMGVLSHYFQFYALTGIRTTLDKWLVESLRADQEDAAEYVEFAQNLQKLVEAAWLINQQQEKAIPEKRTRKKKK